MKVIKGNNNIVLVENIDGSIAQEIELDDKTSVITNSDKTNTFDSKDELRTYIASAAVGKFPTIPNVGEKCEYNKVYKYGVNKVKCVQEHTRMAFTPEETPALWLIIKTVSQSDYPVWKQPTGAHARHPDRAALHHRHPHRLRLAPARYQCRHQGRRAAIQAHERQRRGSVRPRGRDRRLVPGAP